MVAYRSAPFLVRLERDLPGMTSTSYRLHLFDNTDAKRNLSALRNDLARTGSAEYIVFASANIVISPGWDEGLVSFLGDHPEAGVVLPLLVGDRRFPHLWEKEVPPHVLGTEMVPSERKMEELARRVRGYDGIRTYHYPEGPFAPFSVALMRRETWRRLSGFDERLKLLGGDGDFAHRVEKDLGLSVVGLRSSVVYHPDGFSFKEARSLGNLNMDAEWNHFRSIQDRIRSGKLRKWHLLTDEERLEARR